jgi:hypothetical protein
VKSSTHYRWVDFTVWTVLVELYIATTKDALLDELHHSIVLAGSLASAFISDWDAFELGKGLFH